MIAIKDMRIDTYVGIALICRLICYCMAIDMDLSIDICKCIYVYLANTLRVAARTEIMKEVNE